VPTVRPQFALLTGAPSKVNGPVGTAFGICGKRAQGLGGLINTAVTLSVRVDLLFGITNLLASNQNAGRDWTRAAVAALEASDVHEARPHHAAASLSQTRLVNTAAGRSRRQAPDATSRRR